MKRYPRYRPRREFMRLEAQLEPDFERKAWRQFIDSILYNKPWSRSFQDQFRLRGQICRAHRRRNRYNDKRRVKRFQYVLRYMRPEYAAYVEVGLVSVWKTGEEFARPDLLAGLLGVDRRLSRKLLKELEVVHLMLNPEKKPWEIAPEITIKALEEMVKEPADREDFLASLEPATIPEVPEVVPFERVEGVWEPSQDADEPPTRHTQTFASAS